MLTIKTPSRSEFSNRRKNNMALSVLVMFLWTSFMGCATTSLTLSKTIGNDTSQIDSISHQVDNPAPPAFDEVRYTPRPITIERIESGEITYQDMSLARALETGLRESSVLRDMGGTVLTSPETATTGFATQLQFTDPRFGMEAALSAFDAQFKASANFNDNHQPYNNGFFAGGTNLFIQDYHDYQMELSKRTATGSQISFRGASNYDSNNAPANLFASAWNSWVEGELRQPLLQGAGLEFNRIAGPGSTPGVYNGILIAKVNSDITASDFEVIVRDYLSNVENAYWDLYLAYRELDARKKALSVLRDLKDRIGNDDESRVALWSQQELQLKSEVDEAMTGRLLNGTQVRNGASGGTVQVGGGVMAAERRLRLLVGMAATDGTLLRPLDDPPTADMSAMFDWDMCVEESLRERPELRKQNNRVKQREMELLAARNFLNPKLDVVARYRVRGFGDDLLGSGTQTGTTPASSIGNLNSFDNQEWMAGVELTVPIGYRRGHSAVANAELKLSRERAIQKEQQREIISNLTGAFTDVERTHISMENNLAQYIEANRYLEIFQRNAEAGRINKDDYDRWLDAQRRVMLSELQFFRARTEYAIALKNIHYEKGSLKQYRDLRVAQDETSTLTTELPFGSGLNFVPAIPIPDGGMDIGPVPSDASAVFDDTVPQKGTPPDVPPAVPMSAFQPPSTIPPQQGLGLNIPTVNWSQKLVEAGAQEESTEGVVRMRKQDTVQ